jgi:hypothetical protein
MARFKISDLPDRTHSMHDIESKWRQKSWRDSLKNQYGNLEDLLSLIDLYGIWKNRLPRNDATRFLANEIYSDAYMSIHLACYGLYKNAYMSLRSQFETAMRLIYFSDHPLEFKLWETGDENWIKDLVKGSDVWGEGFKYFLFIPEVNSLETNSPVKPKLIKGDNPKLKSVYSKLSKYVHSGGPYLHTKSGRLAPKYNTSEFMGWYEMFKDVQKFINILFALCFSEQFKKMPNQEIDSILDLAIGSDYKEHVKKVCGL